MLLKQGPLAWSPNHLRIFSRFSLSSLGTLKPLVPNSSFTRATTDGTRFNAAACTSHVRYVCGCKGFLQEIPSAVDFKVLFGWDEDFLFEFQWMGSLRWIVEFVVVCLRLIWKYSKFCSLSSLRIVISCPVSFVLIRGLLRNLFLSGPCVVLLALICCVREVGHIVN